MNKKYVLIFFECVGLQLFFSLLSMIFYVSIVPPKLFSFFTAWLLLWALHSTFWQLGNKERKQIAISNRKLEPGEQPKKQNFLKGACVALPYFLINIIFLLITVCTNNDILIIIQSAIHFSFAGFLPLVQDNLDSEYIISRSIVCIVMYIPCITAYISGAHNISLIEKYFPKLIYKNKSDNTK